MKTGCDKECSTCDMNQRTYCAAQLGLKNQELILQQGLVIAQQQEIITGLVKTLSPLFPQDTAPLLPNPGGVTIEKVPDIKTIKN